MKMLNSRTMKFLIEIMLRQFDQKIYTRAMLIYMDEFFTEDEKKHYLLK